jgi:Ca2+-binding EF-hand superfamily protein
MLGSTALQDEMLRAYVDKVFEQFDTDKNGSLDEKEMTLFFNKLFGQLGINQQVTEEQSMEAIRSIDQNFDGSIDKKELF